ncbi:dynein light chain, cytoplasmic [Polytolypa hystricis UAMH7299]|uniref:Dynein light chain n=1 Tax=Polytolypa hystricis (strain UAMH7299) TaxID=1447883 RepID=A0A2B7XVD9_POLH7|nr:dynein light chain, cytoplasmic [Polytolypa hystricis UAMH7299]
MATEKMGAEKREKLEAQIKSADMNEDMQQEAIEVATDAMEKFRIEKDIAQYIKKEFDNRKGATWHCIVGRNFGSFVTHGTFLLLFKPAPLSRPGVPITTIGNKKF